MATKLKVWTGRTGQRRVYLDTRFSRDLPRSVARCANGAYFTEASDGRLAIDGQSETKRMAAEAVADALGIATFSQAIELASK
jgi:hypothetical protein